MSKADVLDKVMKLLGVLVFVVGVTAVLNIPLYLTNYSPFNQQYQAMFWLLVASMIFLTRPATRKTRPARWYDLVMIGITLFVLARRARILWLTVWGGGLVAASLTYVGYSAVNGW